ncbi:M15 family metallopeptidase [Cellulomonas dongxiuzhuiae]|uniref:M15 family metallopeptidase n=1 Tax=Cellulomonas dongxiuzhuiae TaxID=2819979 RepID=A0ABX8GNB6_9CELL|nr:M15 family metallopeptidase [Cellulomonas dongxiuzhuiae]MBO3087779.1 M15 family metallopeptidase [Cellulomonas dongxiuzhuiae]MBO3095840.1 M15 family metallopeptidase [Cellulomonas dongxiuzhuiae]QWC17146.1 M15 family metallopeptidase [Cellulomonas dongxiuzhuiae]
MGSHRAEPTTRARRDRQQRTDAPPVPVAAAPAVEGLGAPAADAPRRWSTRMLGRTGVLAALVAVTVVVPVSQGVADGEIVVGERQVDPNLPSTVTALTAIPLSDLPPTPLVSADGASRLRALAEVSRDAERSALPGCDGGVRAAGSNGLLATKDLCTLWDGRTQMRADAAVALAELNEAHVARFGTDMCLTSGYRTLAQQKAVKAQKGGMAATPGKSNHGWGLAMDFCSIQTSGARWTWLNDNGPTFGWEQPNWAVKGGSGPYEPWHWEYTKGVKADGEYYG